MHGFKVYKLGLVPYKEALELQHSLLQKRIDQEIENTLLLLEHPPTLTTGRRGKKNQHLLVSEDELKKRGIHFEEISRGGDITFHGPGQLVGYPILDLINMGRDVHKYLRNLEEVLIRVLNEYGIAARRVKGVTGVWVKGRKIASIGVGVKRWITYHGFALNVNTDLSYFDIIVPCGIPNAKMTSIQRWLGEVESIDMEEVEERVIRAFSEVFQRELVASVPVYKLELEDAVNPELLLEIETKLEEENDILT